jgi:hypothetical protein
MNQNSVFWASFWAGAASPIALYSMPTPYVLSLGLNTVGGSFAQVGMTLTQTSGETYVGSTGEFQYHTNDGRDAITSDAALAGQSA